MQLLLILSVSLSGQAWFSNIIPISDWGHWFRPYSRDLSCSHGTNLKICLLSQCVADPTAPSGCGLKEANPEPASRGLIVPTALWSLLCLNTQPTAYLERKGGDMWPVQWNVGCLQSKSTEWRYKLKILFQNAATPLPQSFWEVFCFWNWQ